MASRLLIRGLGISRCMLKFISNLFRKSNAVQTAPMIRSGHFNGEAPQIVPTVETAQLSLAAILAKFPADLKGCIQQMPEPTATVALPLPTILKQLPSCSVKMSLASLYRQAPAGVFKPGPHEEKRMVEVPLPEIFKRVRPELLKRREDQRPCAMPQDGYNLFGDKENPRAVALTLPEAPPAPPPPPPAPVIDFSPTPKPEIAEPAIPEPALKKPTFPLAPPADLTASVATKTPTPATKPAKPTKPVKPAPVTPPSPKHDGSPLVMPIGELAANWPELIQAEVGAMNGATVSLPCGEVTTGLAKGRVTFSWGALRAWITPTPPGASGADADTELALPLRVVAPAFLKHTKNGGESRKRIALDEEIPALFHGNDTPPATPLATTPEPIEPPAAVIEPKPLPVPPPPAQPSPTQPSQTIGELFGQPEKTSWTPADIVENVTKLPGVGGAVVAMKEGLLVAQRLPEHLHGEAFAAFLPQIFARLNQYSGEMKLGEVNEVTINTSGGPCQMFRLGEVLFAAIGRAGEPLPSQALSLCAGQIKS